MNILDLIDTKVSSYTKTDRFIYEKLKKFPERFAENSYSDAVEEFGVSPAALTRFAKKLGFNGFNEFQFQLISDLRERNNDQQSSSMAEKFGKALVRTEESISAKYSFGNVITLYGINLPLPSLYFSSDNVILSLNPYVDCILSINASSALPIAFS